jgi:hypothetical protein
MVSKLLKIIPVAAIFLLFGGICRADIIINEVMSNEPGSQVALEWVELYNNSDSTKSLSFYTLEIDDVSFSFPGETVAPRSYFVACRRLFLSGSTMGFESYWGNADSIWGDYTTESYKVFQLSGISLGNDSGTVILKYAAVTKSIFKWTSSGRDGASWERFTPASTVISNSVDSRGATPGKINSITPGQRDLALLSASAYPEAGGITSISLKVANIGLETISEASLGIYYDNNRDSIVTAGDEIMVITLLGLNPYDTILISESVELNGIYSTLLARLPSDDRLNNNTRLFAAPGKNFPPVILSEFIADPLAPLQTEWVEIKNRSDSTINLKGWMLGDALTLYPITATGLTIGGGEYAVLTEDSSAFISFYGRPDYNFLELPGWAALNNSGDQLRLVDHLSFAADSFQYTYTFGDNFSWGRGEETGSTERWGRSVVAGGTPGHSNDIYYEPSSKAIRVETEPNPFSPSRDHQMTISFYIPSGEELTIKLYDIQGRVVKTFLNMLPAMEGQIIWDGTSDGGRPLPVGIYILYLEVFGGGEYKQTIVVAP